MLWINFGIENGKRAGTTKEAKPRRSTVNVIGFNSLPVHTYIGLFFLFGTGAAKVAPVSIPLTGRFEELLIRLLITVVA
jgi:hypothetical protein